MKKIKEMIIPIVVGFTLVNSLYGTFKISELENEIGQLQRELEDKIRTSETMLIFNVELKRIVFIILYF